MGNLQKVFLGNLVFFVRNHSLRSLRHFLCTFFTFNKIVSSDVLTLLEVLKYKND